MNFDLCVVGGGIAGICTAVSAARFIRGGYVDWKLAVPSVALALYGAHLGTRLQLALDETYLKWLLLIVLPIVAVVVLRQKKLPEEAGDVPPGRRTAIVLAASFVVGAYDGFYGPGTGTFLVLIYCGLAKMDLRTASGNVKLVNLASNIGALATSRPASSSTTIGFFATGYLPSFTWKPERFTRFARSA